MDIHSDVDPHVGLLSELVCFAWSVGLHLSREGGPTYIASEHHYHCGKQMV
jgi:hypothetical protein